jgi:hypothetical protein
MFCNKKRSTIFLNKMLFPLPESLSDHRLTGFLRHYILGSLSVIQFLQE